MTESNCANIYEKRGRGRPRKNPGKNLNDIDKLANNYEKRGRGRPRKNPDDTVKPAKKTQLTQAEIDAKLLEKTKKMQESRLKYYQKNRDVILAKNKARLDEHPEWRENRCQQLKARLYDLVKDIPSKKGGRPPKNQPKPEYNSDNVEVIPRSKYITMVSKKNPVGRPRKNIL